MTAKAKIKVIKKSDIKQTIQPAPEFLPKPERVSAAQAVKNWINEHRENKEIQRQNDFRLLFGTN